MEERPTEESAAPGEPATTRPPVDWAAPTADAGVRGSARTRSQWAVTCLGVAGLIGAVAFIHDLSGFKILADGAAGTLTDAAATEFDSQFATIGIAQAVAYVVTAIAFLAWLSRSVDNVPRLGGGTPAVTPGWSIGWWFIPFANLVKPYQIVADLYRRMAPAAGIGTGIVLTWWVFFLMSGILANIAGRFWGAAATLDSLRVGLGLFTISDLADPFGAILGISIVLQVQRWADARESLPPPAEEPPVPGPEPAVALSP